MEKQGLLSKLKSKYLLFVLALLIPTVMVASASQSKKTDVKGVQVSVTVVPTTKPTETPTPTDTPANTPTPTIAPTNTPYPTRAYIAPTKVYVPPTQAPTATQSNSQLDNNNYYTNTAGNSVHSPANTVDNSVPSGASARCGDGTYSFSQSRRGTCSSHGGVAQWL